MHTFLSLSSLLSVDRISFSCLFPASWHFSLSSQVLPRLLIPSIRQLLFTGLVLCLVGLLYLLFVTGKGHASWISKENHFHRWTIRCCLGACVIMNSGSIILTLTILCSSKGTWRGWLISMRLIQATLTWIMAWWWTAAVVALGYLCTAGPGTMVIPTNSWTFSKWEINIASQWSWRLSQVRYVLLGSP